MIKIESNKVEQKELKQQYYKIDFAKIAKLIFADLEMSKTNNILFKTFTKKQVINALQNPQKNEKVLRNLSKFLYVVSPHYKRLCDYYSQMATFDWYIEPYKLNKYKININAFEKAYIDTLNELDNMNIKHEFSKIMHIIFREGVFYGYEYSTPDSYFIQKLDPDYCKISGFEDGVFSFKFDFSYFDKDPSLLNNYAEEFKQKYNLYKNSKKNKKSKKAQEDFRWQELSSEKSICIKTDETVLYPLPPFIGVIPDIYEIQDYKALKKANNEMQNVAILVGTIPYLKDNNGIANNFALDLETAIEFGNKINQELPDQFGFLLSVYDEMELFKFNDDKVGTDKVEEAVNDFWRSTGVSKNLFTDSGNTDSAMKYSVKADEQTVFALLLQFERWINRKLKYSNKKYKFKLNFLRKTVFTETDYINRELKLSQFGVPNKIKLAVATGMSQSSVDSMTFLENVVLKLHENWIPLNSAHIMTTKDIDAKNGAINDGKGRPSKNSEDE